MSSNANIEDLVARLQQVEKAHARWRTTATIAAVAALIMLLVTAQAYSQRQQAQSPQPSTVEGASTTPVDDKGIVPVYANFFRVTGTPEELIIDFGLNSQQQTSNG